jgi:hypothetical protein
MYNSGVLRTKRRGRKAQQNSLNELQVSCPDRANDSGSTPWDNPGTPLTACKRDCFVNNENYAE